MICSQGKNTCETLEIAALIWLQVDRMSEELRLFKGPDQPYESNARENAQNRGFVNAIRDPLLGESDPQ